MELFGIGLGELLLIMALALIVIGPERLPEVASQVGRTVADFRRQANQLTSEFQQSLEVATQERKEQRAAANVGTAGASCTRCGVEAGAGARYCASCGASLGERAPDGERQE